MFESFSYCLCKCKHCLFFLALGVNEFVLFIMPLKYMSRPAHTFVTYKQFC